MKRVRLKVKHIFLIFFFIVSSMAIIIPNEVLYRAEILEKKDIQASKVLYKRYIDYFPFHYRKEEALYKLAQEIVPQSANAKRYIFYANGISIGSTKVTSEMVQNACHYLIEVLQNYQDGNYGAKAYEKLVGYYILDQKFTEAGDWIEWGGKSKNLEIQNIASKYKMVERLIDQQWDSGIEVGEELIKKGIADKDLFMLMGDLQFYKKQYEVAMGFYSKAEQAAKGLGEENSIYSDFFENVSPGDRKTMIYKMKNLIEGDGEIYGSVYIDKKPAPFTFVYLKESKGSKIDSIGDENKSLIAITDFNGKFSFTSLSKNDYILGVGVPDTELTNVTYLTPKDGYVSLNHKERREFNFNFASPMKVVNKERIVDTMDDKANLEWERVENAAYYLIKFIVFENPEKLEGSYIKVGDDTRIYDTKAVIDIEKLNKKGLGVFADEEGKINPQAYLGIFYPGSKVPFYIEAYDEEGNFIKSTAAIRIHKNEINLIHTLPDKRGEGEQLILDGKLEQAIQYYEKTLQKNNKDIAAMQVLSNIYSFGTKRTNYTKGERSEGQDAVRAAQINKRLYELTNDRTYMENSQYALDPVNRKSYRILLGKYLNLGNENMSTSKGSNINDMELELKEYKRTRNRLD